MTLPVLRRGEIASDETPKTLVDRRVRVRSVNRPRVFDALENCFAHLSGQISVWS